MNNRYLSSVAVGLMLFQAHQGWSQNNVGVDVATPLQKLDVNGAIRIGTTPTALTGTIRYTGSDFEGYHGGQWVSLITPTGLLSQTLTNGHIFVGNASNIATGVAMSGVVIQNQTTLQTSSNFYISNVGRTDGSFQSPVYTTAVVGGTVAIRPNTTNSVAAIQLQNAAGTSILNVDATNSRVGIGNIAPDAALEVTGNIMLSKGGVRVISLERPDAGIGADSLVISGASAVVGGNARGGSLVLKAGDAYTGFSAPSGDVYLISGGNTFNNAGASRGDIVFSTGGVSDLGVPAPAIERMRIRNGGTIVSKRDVYIDDNSRGVILRSPNNSCWKLVVDNSGTLTTTSVTCP